MCRVNFYLYFVNYIFAVVCHVYYYNFAVYVIGLGIGQKIFIVPGHTYMPVRI